jgi:hypothetical protein
MLFGRDIIGFRLRRHRDLEGHAEVHLIDQPDRFSGRKDISGHRSVHGQNLDF